MRRLLIATVAAATFAGLGPALSNTEAAGTGGLTGLTVVGRDGQAIGEVTKVVLDDTGAALRVIVSAGGGSRSGGKEIAIDVADLRLRSDSNHLHVPGLTRAEVGGLPDHRPGAAMP